MGNWEPSKLIIVNDYEYRCINRLVKINNET